MWNWWFILVVAIPLVYGGSEYVLSEDQKSRCFADIAFVLDGSGSVGIDNWRKTLEFVYSFAADLPFDLNRFGVVSFGNQAQVNIRFEDFRDYESFRNSVLRIPYLDENTNTADGLRKMRSLYQQFSDRPKIGILITDGVATREENRLLDEANLVREEGINLFGIGIGAQYDIREMEQIIRNPERIYSANDFDDLIANLDKIVGLACSTPVLPTLPPEPPRIPCLSKRIAFLIDASGSVTRGRFNDAKQFLKNFINGLPFEYSFSDIAFVAYSTEAFIKAKFGEIANKEDAIRRIDMMEHINQRTNLSGAIKVAREEIFLPYGVEDGKDKVVVVLTDMKSNSDKEKLTNEVHLAKRLGLKLFAIGLEDTADMAEMSLVASNPKSHFMHFIESYRTLARPDVSQKVKDVICAFPYPQYSLDLRKDECYSDIIFVIDKEVGAEFEKQKRLIKDLAGQLGNCLYAVVQLDNMAYNAVPFNSYESLNGFLSMVDRIPASGTSGSINLASGLDVVQSLLISRTNNVRLGKQLHPYRRFLTSMEPTPGMKKHMDFSELVVFITKANYFADMNEVKFKRDNLHSNFPSMGILAVGYGQQVDMNMIKMLACDPKGMFALKSDSLDMLLENMEPITSFISMVTSPSVYNCDFEQMDEMGNRIPNTCDFVQDRAADFEWTVAMNTPSNETGPQQAYNGSYFAFIEATGRTPGEKAVLSRQMFLENRPIVCLHFYANMHGWHTGKLEVFTVDSMGQEKIVWMQKGRKGAHWKLAVASLEIPFGGRLGFRATRGTGFSSDIALDTVSLHYGSCPIVPQFVAEAIHKPGFDRPGILDPPSPDDVPYPGSDGWINMLL